MTVAYARSAPWRWSLAAFLFAALGVVCSTWIIVGSDGDPSQVRWWVVVLPVALTLVPVLLPRTPVRFGAAVAMGAWCVLAVLSIGVLLMPALAAEVAAVLTEER
jgi:hypothetical protein